MKAIGAATVAMLVIGILLSGISAAGCKASVSTNKDVYATGETVIITMTNPGQDSILLTGYWVEDAAGALIYAPPMLAFAEYLAAGESISWNWAQVDAIGEAVAPGEYTVCISTDSAAITIAAPSLTVSTDARSYDVGEAVTITMRNDGEVPALVCGYAVEDASGALVYAPPMLAFAIYLQPGESCTYSWAQTGADGSQVPAGLYTIDNQYEKAEITVLEPKVTGHDKPAPAKAPIRPSRLSTARA